MPGINKEALALFLPTVLLKLNEFSTFVVLAPMIVFGFLAEYFDGALGMAYGVTSSSMMIALGVAPAVASASIHTAEIGTTLFAGLSHWRFGNIRKDVAIPMIIPGVIGGVIGAALLSCIPGKTTKPIVALFLLSIGALIFSSIF